MDIMALMKEFHDKLDPVNPNEWMMPYRLRLRCDLLIEEVNEYRAGSDALDFVQMADALGDIVYVAFGTAYCMDIDLNRVARI